MDTLENVGDDALFALLVHGVDHARGPLHIDGRRV
tara:strand:- start:37 stop:141 length:105 start_codon:yes stop_codon:yes gene_type:complete